MIKLQTPLLDGNFLRELDNDRNRVLYARITSLTIDSLPIERIEGVFTGGSITLDGTSSVRHICNLTMTTKNINIDTIYWGMSSRVKIEIGLKNRINNNYDDIIWFPGGVYILTDFKTSQSVNNYTITLTGKDKMCLLNGEIGGKVNAETDFGTVQSERVDGSTKIEKVPVYMIIKKMIHDYAHDPYNNILVKDIDTLAQRVSKNKTGDAEHPLLMIQRCDTDDIIDVIMWDTKEKQYKPLAKKDDWYYWYLAKQGNVVFEDLVNGKKSFNLKRTIDEDNVSLVNDVAVTSSWDKIIWHDCHGHIDDDNHTSEAEVYCWIIAIDYGKDAGYEMQELYYPDDLIAAAGDTITSVLDKIINQFGDFEYYYNLDGQFVFQSKLSYIHTRWNGNDKYQSDSQYFIGPADVAEQVKYSFESNALTTAYQNSPNMGKVKNDYTVWGQMPAGSGSGVELPIHMRYAIDKKPDFYRAFDGTIYITEDSNFNPNMPEEVNKYRWKNDPTLPANFWTFQNWLDYYEDKTGIRPRGSMSRYSNSTSRGWNNAVILVSDEPQVISNLPQYENSEDVTYFNCPNMFILVADQDNRFIKAHSLDENVDFVTLLTYVNALHYCVYLYNPYLPDCDNPEKENTSYMDYGTIKKVDWREIIYHMAEDYYNYGDEDTYAYQLHHNNTIESLHIDLYDGGRTKYEQYYQDILGFWRLLYVPEEDKQNYFNSQSKIVLTPATYTGQVAWKLVQEQNDDQAVPHYYMIYQQVDDLSQDAPSLRNQKILISNNGVDFYDPEQKEEEENKPVDQREEIQSFNLENNILCYERIIHSAEQSLNKARNIHSELERLNKYQNVLANKEKYQQLINAIDAIEDPIEKSNKQPLKSTYQSTLKDLNKTINESYDDLNNIDIETKKSELEAEQKQYLIIPDSLYNDTPLQCKDIAQMEAIITQMEASIIPGYKLTFQHINNQECFYESIEYTSRGFILNAVPYSEEHKEVWGSWNKDVFLNPSSLIFWFDFFNAEGFGLGQFSVPAIGARPEVVKKDTIKALIYEDIPDVIFIRQKDYDNFASQSRQLSGYSYIVIPDKNNDEQKDILDYLEYSTRSITAQEEIDNLLYNLSYCNENITITSVPIFYLEPNTIISARDFQEIVNGYYILQKITLPLAYNGTMQLTAIKVPERIY